MITVVGMGPGDPRYRTQVATDLIAKADVLVGWPRMLSGFSDFHGETHVLDADLDKLLSWLKANAHRNVVVLASGDPLIFGIGKRLAEQLPVEQRQIISGISAVQYLFARIGLDMNDLYLTSSHGKQPDFDFIFQHDKVAMVTDREIGPFQIAQEIRRRGLNRSLVIGENLSYPNEQIHLLKPDQVKQQYDMNVVVILNERC